MFFPDFGRGAVKFQRFQNLWHEQDGEAFRSLTTKMSCLIAVAEMSNELEVAKLMDIMHDLKIAQKHLIVVMDTFNTTMLAKRRINFNVMINHRGKPGMLCVILLLLYD